MARRKLAVCALPIDATSGSEPSGSDKLCWRLGKDRSLLAEDELGITELPHLRKIQTSHLGFRRNPLPDEEFEPQVQEETEGEDKAQQGRNADQLRRQLTCVAIEEAGDGTRDTVPASSVVTGAVSKQAHGQYSPQAVGAVYRNSADGIVHFQHIFDKRATQANQNTSNQTDDGGIDRADKTAGSRDSHQPRQQAVAAHRGIRFPLETPHVKQRTERTCAACQHGVHRDRSDSEVAVCRGTQGASRIESEPSEGKDKAADQYSRDIMAYDCVAGTIAIE